ncbi:glycoside hydrolase family 5 protein, partial [Bacteroidales bacterium OttesenSCG-928-M06]|nr:glycoside hydrolase family 5 protein [Bacteroidales bacterium OttesenSCG-928-M06]
MKAKFFTVFFINVLLNSLSVGAAPLKEAPTPNISSGIYISIYGGENSLASTINGVWNNGIGGASSSEEGGGRKFVLNPSTIEDNNCNVPYVLPAPVNSRNNECDYFHVDLFFENQNLAKQFRILFYASTNTDAGWGYAYYESPVIEGSKIGTQWVSIDIPISELGGNIESGKATKDQILADIARVQVNNMSKNAGIAQPLTVYIDNIYFYKKDQNIPQYESLTPPALSSVWGADKVTSIFSNAYTNTGAISSFVPDKTDFNIDNNSDYSTWRFGNTTNVSMSGNINVSGKNHFHMDVWTKDVKTFQIRLNDTYLYPETNPLSRSTNYFSTSGDNWTAIDIELPNGVSQIDEIEILGTSSTTYFVDNIYFYSDEVLVSDLNIWDANKALGRGMNLGNGFEEQGYNLSGNTFNVEIAKELIDKIATINEETTSGNKFDHVRIPVRWDLWGKKDDGTNITGGRPYRTDTDFPYAIDPGFMSDVKTIVDYTLDKGLKVVLNVHHYNTLYADFEAQKPRFLAIWAQIAEQFKFYDHNLYFEMLNEPRQPGSGGNERMNEDNWTDLIPETLPIMRTGGANATRPILVTSFDWGSFPYLEKLILPEGDQKDDHLIVTVHNYDPGYITSQGGVGSSGVNTNIEWWDMQTERDLIQTFLTTADRFQERYPDVPIHVGEFGSARKAETDSRSLWITYMRDVFERRGYSWCYWEFRAGYGFYNYNSGQYDIPIVKALLSNTVPVKPASHSLHPVRTIYDLSVNGNSGWSVGTATPNKLVINFTSRWGSSKNNNNYTLTEDASCRISFKAFSNKEEANFLVSTTGNSKTSEFIFSPGINTEGTEYSFIVNLLAGSVADHISFQLISPLEKVKPVQLTIDDLRVEIVEKRHEAAPLPTLTEVNNIYSTFYSDSQTLDFSGVGTASYIKDNSSETGNNIIQIADFANQTISFPSTNVGSHKTLHLSAYAGSQMKGLTVKVNGANGSVTSSFDLPSHTWQHLGVDLGNLTSISSIELSGGTGDGRKLFLDHIYLQIGDVPENIEKISAADTPVQTNVVNFYSTEYGMDNSLNYSDAANKTTATDTNGNSVLKFNNFTTQKIEYAGNGNVLNLGNKNNINIDIYPEERFPLSVKLIYYKDGVDNPSTNVVQTIAPVIYSPGKWHNLNISIEDFVTQTEGKISAIQLISDNESTDGFTLYLDHSYFYYEPLLTETDPTVSAYIPPSTDEPEKVIPIFSDYYTASVTPDFSYRPAVITVENDDIWRFKQINNFDISLGTGVDITSMTHLHIDIWTQDAANFEVYLNDPEYKVSKSTTNNQWLRLDIPISDFTEGLNSINKLGIVGAQSFNYYLDNIYFYNNNIPFTPSPIEDVNEGLGKGMNLGDLLDKDNSNWSVDLIEGYISKIKELGEDNNRLGHVRLPIDWSLDGRYMANDPYNLDPEFIVEDLKPIVDNILAQGMKVIIALPSNVALLKQITDYFRYYPETLLFEIKGENQETALPVIRVTNPGRAILVNSSLSAIEQLIIGQDNHLILSTSYMPGDFTVWNDIQEERTAVNEELSILENVSIPVNIGAFGLSDELDMDSRALWTTYVARYFDQNSYSWTYWNFTGNSGIYNQGEDKFYSPLVSALLFNEMPNPQEFVISLPRNIYDSSSDSKINTWELRPNFVGMVSSNLEAENGILQIRVETEEDPIPPTGMILIKPDLEFEINSSEEYEVRFTIISSKESDLEFKACIGDLAIEEYETYPFLAKKGEYEYSFSFIPQVSAVSQLYFYLGGLAEYYVLELSIGNIFIKTKSGQSLHAAPIPSLESTSVTNIFSTKFGENNAVDFSETSQTVVSEEMDENGKSVKLLSDFDSQEIAFTNCISTVDKNTLHLRAYPGSVLDLTVTLHYEPLGRSLLKATGQTKSATYLLDPHLWNEISMDLSELGGATISSIELSGGTGAGRKLYLDHIYLYQLNREERVIDADYGSVTLTATDDNNQNCEWFVWEEESGLFVKIDNETTNSYTFDFSENSSRKYQVTYSDETGDYEITVVIRPINRNSQAVEGNLNSQVELSVDEVENITYKWEYSAEGETYDLLQNQTSYMYTINSVQVSHAGIYRVTWSTETETWIESITLTVNTDPANVLVWTGAVDNDWNKAGNWDKNVVPGAATDVYIPGKGITNYPYLTSTETGNVCRNIYILQGGEVGRQDLLTYEKAHVQFNWGLGGYTQQVSDTPELLPYPATLEDQLTGEDLSEHLKFSAGNSSIVGGNRYNDDTMPSNGRERWVLLTPPLKGMYSGDMSFGGYPSIYMQHVRVENKEAKWSQSFATNSVALKPALGYALFVRQGDYLGALGYREDDGEGKGLRYVNGIVEFPYYENPEMSSAHRIHQYNETSKESAFYYVYSSDYSISNKKDEVIRDPEADYRFIVEDENKETQQYQTLAIEPLEANSEILIGNPYMSTIDFEKLVELNSTILGTYYRIWTGSGYKSYSFASGTSTGDLNKYIAPMQSFLVELNQEVGESGLKLDYDISQLSVIPQTYPGLKSSNEEKSVNPVLTIQAFNEQYSSSALLTMGNQFEMGYKSTEDVYKLFTNIANVPEVYTLSG